MQIWESVGNLSFSFIFWDILDEMKDNFGQECVKGGFYLSRAKFEQLPLISVEQ